MEKQYTEILQNIMIKIGIIGLGYWGPNLLRNFDYSSDFEVIYVCDKNVNVLNKLRLNSKNKIKTDNISQILKDKSINAVAISTPVKSHYEIAKKALRAGKHVFIEKPLADSSYKCKKLIRLAKQKSLTLFVDHTFLYTDAVKKIKLIINNKGFGELLYYDSTRINLGLIQSDINVLWDLAVHDLSILNHISNLNPQVVSAVGHKHIKNKPETAAYLTVKYQNNFIAHINVNWLSPVKIRKTILGGSNKMIVYNDLEPSDKITIYNKGVNVVKNQHNSSNLINYKIGDTLIPSLKNKEALSEAVQAFYKSIKIKGYKSKSNGNDGLNVVNILEAADKSMAKNGKPMKVSR